MKTIQDELTMARETSFLECGKNKKENTFILIILITISGVLTICEKVLEWPCVVCMPEFLRRSNKITRSIEDEKFNFRSRNFAI